MWLDKPEQWEALAGAMRKAGEYGIDTETYGQPDKTSPQHRASIHCWSVGLLTSAATPRGFRRAVGRVLPRAALDCPALREVIADPGVRGWAHNAPHDRHALNNEGVEVGGLEDSLQWLRVAMPGLAAYGLKEAERWALGYGPRPSFLEMVSYQAEVVSARGHREKGCICGAKPCRAKSISDFCDVDGVWRPHLRVSWKVFTPIKRVEGRRLEVTDFVPDAVLPPLVWGGRVLDRLKEWWDYSAADAIRGIELVDWIRSQRRKALVYPWVKT